MCFSRLPDGVRQAVRHERDRRDDKRQPAPHAEAERHADVSPAMAERHVGATRGVHQVVRHQVNTGCGAIFGAPRGGRHARHIDT